jgi:hypothetical protein
MADPCSAGRDETEDRDLLMGHDVMLGRSSGKYRSGQAILLVKQI